MLMTQHYPDLGSDSFLQKVCFNQSEARYPDLVGNASSVWNFCAPFSDVISQRNQWQRREIAAAFFSGYRTWSLLAAEIDGFDGTSDCCITL